MKKIASRKLANDPLAGIPEAERREVQMVMAMGVYMGKKPMTPEEAYSWLQADRARKAAEQAAQQEKRDAEYALVVRNNAIEDLATALNQLVNVRDLVQAIEGHYEAMSYLEYDVLAGFAQIAIKEAGSRLEQALCDLGLVREGEHGYFVDNLKSQGVKMEPIPEEEEEEETQ